MSLKTILKARNLYKAYTTEDISTVALDHIQFDINQGEFVCIMGPSGCGKTTLLNLIGLLDTPTSGDLFFLDKDVRKLSQRELTLLRRLHIGFVFQSFNLIDELTIYENVELPLIYQRISAYERRSRVNSILERLNIAHKQNYFPKQLSGGQQQRAAVGRAIVTQPAIVLADEPTGNLDSLHGQEVMDILSELNDQGTTVIVVTHSPTYARFGHRIVHLFDGHIVTEAIRN